MKKIIIATFAFVLLFATQSLEAASVWNGASNDCQGIAVANHTTQTGIVYPCWPLTTLNANNGEVVNIRIYYHNTSNAAATNVKVSLSAPTSASNTHTFSGQITSDQGSLSLGSVRFTTASGTTLKYAGAHWLPNQKQTESSLLYGQSGAEVLGGGLSIGTINPGWDTQGSVVVAFTVNGPTNPPSTVPTGTLTPNKTSCAIQANASSCDINFSWNTNNPVGTSYVTRDGGPTVATGNSDSKAFTIPYSSATFRLVNNGLELDTEAVTSYCTSGTSWNGSTCYPNLNPTDSCSISSFTANGSLNASVTLGNGIDLAWTSSGCNYVNIDGVGSSLAPNDHKTIYPSTSGNYKITGYGSSGASPARTVYITVNPVSNPTYTCSITNFTVNGSQSTTIRQGDSAEVYWNTSNCNTINIPGVGYNLENSGHYTISPNSSTRYTLTASGNNSGVQTRTVEVSVNRNSNPTYSCSIREFDVDNSSVRAGESIRLNWDTENCSNVTISNVGSVYSSGSRVIYPPYSTTYVLSAYGYNGGSQSRYVRVTVNPYNYYEPVVPIQPIIPVYNKCAVTTLATNINQTSAQLNGLVSGAYGANTYFEYGPTVNLGYRTGSRYVNSNTNFTEIVSNLSPNTIYYFRMVSDCQGGLSQGSIEVFRTQAIPTITDTKVITKTVYVDQGKTVVGAESPIMLNISNRYELIGEGDLIDYIVTYKNIGKVKLIKPMVQVVLPTNVTLVNASRGTYAVDTHTLSAQIEDLNAGQEGVIYIQGRVDSIPLNNSQIASTAILIYTTPAGAQENAMAYVLNRPKVMAIVDGANELASSAFFSGFLSIGLVGWLIIILIILLLILIVRSVYGGRGHGDNVSHTPTH